MGEKALISLIQSVHEFELRILGKETKKTFENSAIKSP